LRLGAVYFNHPTEREYVGPRLARDVGATHLQLDFAEMSTWYQVHKGEGYFDWRVLDRAYVSCEAEGVSPMISLAHHFCPPPWVREGPFNQDLVETPQYADRFGTQFGKMTLLQKEWCEYVTALVRRYGDRTNNFICSHEWNLNWLFYAKMGTPQFELYLRNQMACTILAYKIVREQVPGATFSYGLLAQHKRDKPDGRVTSSLHQTIEDWPLGPSAMIKKYIQTGDRDYLNLMRTTYLFYLSHTDNPTGLAPIFMDTLAGEAAEGIYRAEATIEGKNYRYRDHISSFIVLPFCISGAWGFNRAREYSEQEQAAQIIGSIDSISSAAKRGVPVEMILLMLVDKNEYYSNYAFDQWRFVPEGMYKMKGQIDRFRTGPADWEIEFQPKAAVEAVVRKEIR
jgi:hypothetical protein